MTDAAPREGWYLWRRENPGAIVDHYWSAHYFDRHGFWDGDRELTVVQPGWTLGRRLPSFDGPCTWHPDAGFCTDELRTVTHWHPETTKMLRDAARYWWLLHHAKVIVTDQQWQTLPSFDNDQKKITCDLIDAEIAREQGNG